MRRIIFFSTLILAYFSQGCSDIHNTPSAIVLKHYESRQNGDMVMLQSTMTREGYFNLLHHHVPGLKGEGKVFAYDQAHYATDPASLRRLESRLSEYFRSLPETSIELISEKALDERTREIYMKENGIEKKAVLTDIDSQWKISRFSGE